MGETRPEPLPLESAGRCESGVSATACGESGVYKAGAGGLEGPRRRLWACWEQKGSGEVGRGLREDLQARGPKPTDGIEMEGQGHKEQPLAVVSCGQNQLYIGKNNCCF